MSAVCVRFMRFEFMVYNMCLMWSGSIVTGVCFQVVDTLGVMGAHVKLKPSRIWKPKDDTTGRASMDSANKQKDLRKSAGLSASRDSASGVAPPEVVMIMRNELRLSGHTRYYSSDSLPKGLRGMPGYRIEPLRQRCFNDPADSSVTFVRGHCLRSRDLPHNARKVTPRRNQDKKLAICSHGGGDVYQFVFAQFQSRRRSDENENDNASKVGSTRVLFGEHGQTNWEEKASEVDVENIVVGTVDDERQASKEDAHWKIVDNNKAALAVGGNWIITGATSEEYESDASSIRSDLSYSSDTQSSTGARSAPKDSRTAFEINRRKFSFSRRQG